MVFQGLDQHQAETTWRPFFEWLAASPQDFSIVSEPKILALPARHFWDSEFLKKVPGLVLTDDRPGASEANVFWAGNLGETGQVLHGYQSTWIPASLLQEAQQKNLADALFAAAQHWRVTLHVNKGLAGAPAEAIAAARDTAMNPSVLDAFALIISGAEGPPAYPGILGHEPDLVTARQHADAIDKAMNEVRKLLPNAGSYVSESNFFDEAWRESFWGSNYETLLAVKDKYDPDGLFFVHHGVGSERWSPQRLHEIDVTLASLASLTFGLFLRLHPRIFGNPITSTSLRYPASDLHCRRHIGEMKLYTHRLRLEPLEERHAELLFDGLQSPNLYQFTPDAPPRTVDELRTRYRKLARRHSPDGTELWLNWAVWTIAENRYVGYVQATITEERSAHVAYVLFPDAWGKGYGREAVKRMIDHLGDEFHHPEFKAYVDLRNHRSISLLQDLGFVMVGIRQGAAPTKGVLYHEAEYRKP